MKKIVVVVAVLVLALVVAPWGVGKVAEKRLNAGLDKLVEQAPYLKVVDRKWTGGWFKSEQVVTFEAFSSWIDAMNPKAIEDAMKKDAAEAGAAVEPSWRAGRGSCARCGSTFGRSACRRSAGAGDTRNAALHDSQ